MSRVSFSATGEAGFLDGGVDLRVAEYAIGGGFADPFDIVLNGLPASQVNGFTQALEFSAVTPSAPEASTWAMMVRKRSSRPTALGVDFERARQAASRWAA
jgi:hypothetical protein